MPRIVSGTGQNVNEALLQGLQVGQAFRAARSDREQRQLKLQEAMADLQKERAKALADANARAQRGELQALQQQEMERVAAGLPPEAKMLGEYVGLHKHLVEQGADPKLIKDAQDSFGEVVQGIQKQKQQEAFQMAAQKAGAAGLIDPNEYTVRAQSGESLDNLTQEIAKKWETEKLARTAEKRNMKAREQAELIVEGLPEDSEQRIIGETILSEMDMDVDGLRTPGYGPSKLKELRALQGAVSEGLQSPRQVLGSRQAAQPAPGLQGMTVGERNAELERGTAPHPAYAAFQDIMGILPGIPDSKGIGVEGPRIPEFKGGTRATLKKLAKKDPVRLAQSLAGQAKNAEELLDRLEELGAELTVEQAKQIGDALRAGRSGK